MTQSDIPALEGGTPVRQEFLVFGRPQIRQAEIDEVVDVLRSGWIGTGPRTHAFEDQFAKYVGAPYAIALNSCTAGLELALDALGVGVGDEVITTPLTFTATANVIVHRGATPVFADVNPVSMNIDPAEIERRLTTRTKVLLPVHFAGRACELDTILDIARQHQLFVLEDAAHAIETYYRDQKVGNIGDITAFSFYVTKNVVTGEGGMVTTANDEWSEQMRIKSLHGISKDAWKRYSESGFQPYDTLYAGYKYNMMDLQAALGLHQLARVEENLRLRERYWEMYDEAFADMPEIITPSPENDGRHARHLYTILLDLDLLRITRNEFIGYLQAENIGCGIHFLALHLHTYYREHYGWKPGDFPNAEFISERTVSLPLSAQLAEDDICDVITAIRKITQACRR